MKFIYNLIKINNLITNLKATYVQYDGAPHNFFQEKLLLECLSEK